VLPVLSSNVCTGVSVAERMERGMASVFFHDTN